MLGTMSGSLIAILYFLIFQFCGLRLVNHFLHHERLVVRLLVGSVFGSVLLQWMPVLFAFVFDFTRMGHAAAAIVTVIVTLLLCRNRNITTVVGWDAGLDYRFAILPLTVYCVFACILSQQYLRRDICAWAPRLYLRKVIP